MHPVKIFWYRYIYTQVVFCTLGWKRYSNVLKPISESSFLHIHLHQPFILHREYVVRLFPRVPNNNNDDDDDNGDNDDDEKCENVGKLVTIIYSHKKKKEEQQKKKATISWESLKIMKLQKNVNRFYSIWIVNFFCHHLMKSKFELNSN